MMIPVLLISWLLRIARRRHPEMFDPVAALESIEAAIAETAP